MKHWIEGHWFAMRIEKYLWDRNKNYMRIRFWFHGVAYLEPWSDTYVVMLWPFNIIVGFARWVGVHFRHSPFLHSDPYYRAYKAGLRDGLETQRVTVDKLDRKIEQLRRVMP